MQNTRKKLAVCILGLGLGLGVTGCNLTDCPNSNSYSEVVYEDCCDNSETTCIKYHPKLAKTESYDYNGCSCDKDSNLDKIRWYINYWIDLNDLPKNEIKSAKIVSDKDIWVRKSRTGDVKLINVGKTLTNANLSDDTLLFDSKPSKITLIIEDKYNNVYNLDILK